MQNNNSDENNKNLSLETFDVYGLKNEPDKGIFIKPLKGSKRVNVLLVCKHLACVHEASNVFSNSRVAVFCVFCNKPQTLEIITRAEFAEMCKNRNAVALDSPSDN